MGPIILCHAFEDKKVVRRVCDALLASGFEIWMDLESVFGEQEWGPEMANWLEQATCMLVFLSKNSVRKMDSTHHEFGQLINTWKNMPEGTMHIIPVRINDCPIPDLLSRLAHIDLFNDEGLEQLIHCLHEGRARRVQKPREKVQDNALGGFHVAVDGRGNVVDVPRTLSDQPMGAEITTDAVKNDPGEEDDTPLKS